MKSQIKSLEVQNTANTALTCKWSAVYRGYWDDQFINDFTPKSVQRPQSPYMNKAYFYRHCVLESVIESLLIQANRTIENLPNQRLQLVILGSGMDSRALRYLQDPRKYQLAVFEVDLEHNIHEKIACLRKSQIAKEAFPEWELPAGNPPIMQYQPSDKARVVAQVGRHSLLAADLRAPPGELLGALARAGLDPGQPTVVLAECVLTYMPPSAARRLLAALAGWLGPAASPGGGGGGGAAAVLYERTGRPGDPVSDHIARVLGERGLELAALNDAGDRMDSPQAWANLLRRAGWAHAGARDMNAAVRAWVPREEARRVGRLEAFDEHAALRVFQGHYCVATARTAGAFGDRCGGGGGGGLPAAGRRPRGQKSDEKPVGLDFRLSILEDELEELEEKVTYLEQIFQPNDILPKSFSLANGFIVREVQKHDTQQVQDLIRESLLENNDHPSVKKFVKNTMKKQLRDISRDFTGNGSKGQFWVCENLEKRLIVGCVGLLYKTNQEGELKHLAVGPRWRRRGLGRALARAVERAAASRGLGKLHLSTLESMAPANSLYRSLGYSATSPCTKHRQLEGEINSTTHHCLDKNKEEYNKCQQQSSSAVQEQVIATVTSYSKVIGV